MSMISAQIDELRNAARGQKVMGLFELARMLNDAADTIWQLRDDLQRANAENAKLRELVRIAIEYCVNGYCAEEDECPLYESRHSCRLQAEARELGVDA